MNGPTTGMGLSESQFLLKGMIERARETLKQPFYERQTFAIGVIPTTTYFTTAQNNPAIGNMFTAATLPSPRQILIEGISVTPLANSAGVASVIVDVQSFLYHTGLVLHIGDKDYLTLASWQACGGGGMAGFSGTGGAAAVVSEVVTNGIAAHGNWFKTLYPGVLVPSVTNFSVRVEHDGVGPNLVAALDVMITLWCTELRAVQ